MNKIRRALCPKACRDYKGVKIHLINEFLPLNSPSPGTKMAPSMGVGNGAALFFVEVLLKMMLRGFKMRLRGQLGRLVNRPAACVHTFRLSLWPEMRQIGSPQEVIAILGHFGVIFPPPNRLKIGILPR